jgi:hypothetical protein|tara:strand:- start:11022 stop:12629 length:1608 start_codon:yes stop_codon:yes gene_type:complete
MTNGLNEIVPPEPEANENMDGFDMDDLDENFDEEFISPSFSTAPEMRPVDVGNQIHTSPLFQHSEQFPRAVQLRVYHLQEGVPHSVGKVGLGATEDELIGKFRSACPGKFILRPVDELGQYLGSEFTHTVSRHHTALAMQSSEAVATAGHDPSDVLMSVMQERERQISAKESRIESELRRQEHQMQEQRSLIQDERADIAAERVAMASQASSTTAAISERQLEAASQHHRETFTAMTQLFQNTNSMMQQMIQWQGQNHEQAMERARNDQQFALDRATASQERERERDRSRAKEAAVIAGQARENDRAHFRAVTELQQNNGTLGGAKKLLNEFGLTPSDLFTALKGGDGDSSGTGSAIIGVLGDVAKSFASASGEAAKAQAEAQVKQLEIAAAAQGRTARLPAPQDEDFLDVEYYDDDEADFEAPAPEAPAVAGSPPDVLAAFRAPHPTITLDLAVQKKARIGLRQLVQRVSTAPSSEWEAIITLGVGSTPEIYEYVKAVTIRKALVEAGATNGLDSQIIDAIDRTGLVPAEVPRG